MRVRYYSTEYAINDAVHLCCGCENSYEAWPWKQQLLKASQKLYGYVEMIMVIP